MSERIIATDENIREIVKSEIARLGNQADLNHVDVSDVKNMSQLFSHLEFNGNISRWNVSNATDMSSMFNESTFNGDISLWDVSKVENMDGMFRNAAFNGDISRWNVSNVYYMENMFRDSQFNGNISNWDVSNVEDMYDMFKDTQFSGDVSNWNVNDSFDIGRVLANSPAVSSPSFGKLHFMEKAYDNSVDGMDEKSIVLHPNAEVAYATFMPIARAMYPNESGAVQAAKAWEAYQASLSQGASESYDYTVALDTEWTG